MRSGFLCAEGAEQRSVHVTPTRAVSPDTNHVQHQHSHIWQGETRYVSDSKYAFDLYRTIFRTWNPQKATKGNTVSCLHWGFSLLFFFHSSRNCCWSWVLCLKIMSGHGYCRWKHYRKSPPVTQMIFDFASLLRARLNPYCPTRWGREQRMEMHLLDVTVVCSAVLQ